MDEKYKKYEKLIKKEHQFGFWNNPSYEEFIELPIKKFLFLPLAEKVIGLLGWEIILRENDSIYARSKEDWGIQGKINISYLEYSKIKVFSQSALDQRWDNGKNSLRVKLFVKVFSEELERLTREEKDIIIADFQEAYNWDDYEIPDNLPLPNIKKVIPLVPIIGYLTSVGVIGIFAGFVDYEVIAGNNQFRIFNLPIISEAIIAVILWLIFTRLCKLGNFTNILKIKRLVLVSLPIFLFMTDVTFYVLLKFPWISPLDFLSFIFNYYEPFFTKRDALEVILNLATILLFLFMITFVFWVRLIGYISTLQFQRIPDEVFEFVEYLFVKNKSEAEIRYELSKKGWESEQAQDEVFEAVGGFVQGIEFLKS